MTENICCQAVKCSNGLIVQKVDIPIYGQFVIIPSSPDIIAAERTPPVFTIKTIASRKEKIAYLLKKRII